MKNLMRVGAGREVPPTRVAGNALKCRVFDLPEVEGLGAQEGKEREAAPTVAGGMLWRGASKSPGEHRPCGPGRAVRTFAGIEALKSRDILTFWSSEQGDVMSETTRGQGRRKADRSAEGKGSGG